MAQVIRRELQFAAARIELSLGQRHDAGAVNKDVQRLALGEEARSESVDRSGVEQVQRPQFGARHAGHLLRRARDVSRRHDHARAGSEEDAHGLEAETRIAAGDDRRLAREAGAGHHLACRACGAET